MTGHQKRPLKTTRTMKANPAEKKSSVQAATLKSGRNYLYAMTRNLLQIMDGPAVAGTIRELLRGPARYEPTLSSENKQR